MIEFIVIPTEKNATKLLGVLDTAKLFWEIWPIFKGLKLRLLKKDYHQKHKVFNEILWVLNRLKALLQPWISLVNLDSMKC